MEPLDSQIAAARNEMMAAVSAVSAEKREEVLVDLLVLLRGVVFTNQEPGPAHTAAREVGNSTVEAALHWLRDPLWKPSSH